MNDANDTPPCVVIGAGLSGLVAAHTLRRGGRSVVVFEADALPGGKMRTRREDGWLFEWGPQSYLREEGSAFERVLAWAGLEDGLAQPQPNSRRRFVLRGGKMRRMPAQVYRILSPSGLLRAACEPLIPRRLRGEDETVHDFARRRFGAQAAGILFDALISGIFAGDPKRLEVASAFPRMLALERDYGSLVRAMLTGGFKPRPLVGIQGGMGTLPEALAEQLGGALHLSTPVTALTPPSDDQPNWRVHTGDEIHQASAVIVSAPAEVAANLTRGFEAPLADLLDEIPYAGLAVVAMGYDRSAFPNGAPEGFGFLVPRREGLRTLGCLFPSAIFQDAAPRGKVQLRVMIGGRLDPAAATLEESELVALARREVEPVTGAIKGPERSVVFRHTRAIPQYEVGHARRMAGIAKCLSQWPGLHLTGNPYRGVSLGDVAADAERVAQAVLGK